MNLKNFIILFVIVVYTCVFAMVNLGYYEYSNYKKKTLTETQIKKFENDIKKGYNIDISSYINNNDDFSNKPKRTIAKVSEIISNYTRIGISKIFKMLNKFIEN